jgi:hypothetical protein
MNILEHPIHKDIYDLCQEIENLPPSEQATKCVVMASKLHDPASKLLAERNILRKALVGLVGVDGKEELESSEKTHQSAGLAAIRALIQTSSSGDTNGKCAEKSFFYFVDGERFESERCITGAAIRQRLPMSKRDYALYLEQKVGTPDHQVSDDNTFDFRDHNHFYTAPPVIAGSSIPTAKATDPAKLCRDCQYCDPATRQYFLKSSPEWNAKLRDIKEWANDTDCFHPNNLVLDLISGVNHPDKRCRDLREGACGFAGNWFKPFEK